MSHAAKQQKNKAVPLPTAGQSAKEEAKTLVAAEAARVVAILSLIDWTGVRQSLRDSGFEEEWIVRGIEVGFIGSGRSQKICLGTSETKQQCDPSLALLL